MTNFYKSLVAIAASVMALFMPTSSQASTNDLVCMARAVYYEARGEPLVGQIAVAHVVRNRANSNRFPSTYCGVVYQRSQFSWTSQRVSPPRANPWSTAMDVARRVHNGLVNDPTGGALYFHATSIRPSWSRGVRIQIGNHIFVRGW